MAKQQIETVRELIYLSYSNLAMAHTAVDKKQEKYGAFNYMIRARFRPYFPSKVRWTRRCRKFNFRLSDLQQLKREKGLNGMDEFQRSIFTIDDNQTLFETDLQLL